MKIYRFQRLFFTILALFFAVQSCELLDDPQPTDVRDNYTGSWTCFEFSQDNPNTDPTDPTGVFSVTFSKAQDDSTKMFLRNLSDRGKSVEVGVSQRSLTISSQTIQGFQFSGSGSADNRYQEINLTYRVNDGTGAENFKARLESQ
jgi:hypothetical protein